jgi:hypothetical protein
MPHQTVARMGGKTIYFVAALYGDELHYEAFGSEGARDAWLEANQGADFIAGADGLLTQLPWSQTLNDTTETKLVKKA